MNKIIGDIYSTPKKTQKANSLTQYLKSSWDMLPDDIQFMLANTKIGSF